MPRPKPDTRKITSDLIAAAEAQLERTNGRKLVLSDLADRVGISQSHVHTFFPTKAHLVRALAIKWFEAVEAKSAEIVGSDAPAETRLENWVLGILRLKRQRFDENPTLFRAYLELAGAHIDLVAQHVSSLRSDLATILSDMVPPNDLNATVTLVEDATLLFRTPQNIAAYRHRATDAAARAVCRMLFAQIGAGELPR